MVENFKLNMGNLSIPPVIARAGEKLCFSFGAEILKVELIEGQDVSRSAWAKTEVAAALIRAAPQRAADIIRADLDTAIEVLKSAARV
jgi:hypothetical protein